MRTERRRLRQRMPRILAALTVAAFAISLLSACSHGDKRQVITVPGGSPEAGKDLIDHYDCARCHTIPGIKGADALVGPPLIHWSRRSFIAGELANTPDNLIRWIHDPKGVEPGTDMPDLGVSNDEARNIAAYLMTIK